MTDKILGIDLGTSSVKLIYCENGSVKKLKRSYLSVSPDGWWDAICSACQEIDLSSVRVIGLSSQVGTYVIDGCNVIGWNEPTGKDQLDRLLSSVTREEFIEEISMPHPRLISYPLPRLMYIKEHFPNAKRIGMPKDILTQRLTGNFISDPFSWRGLANLTTGKHSVSLLNRFGLQDLELPSLSAPQSIVGTVTKSASSATGIPVGTPVCVGCNDFFSALIGMGVLNEGDAFDITGTSEHLGIIRSDIPSLDDLLVCGAYFYANAHYGVTANSGKATELSLDLDRIGVENINSILENDPPIFLPYLNGERAPIWDPAAKGVYLGINERCTRRELAYSALEGVLFSIYHIYTVMGLPYIQSLTVSGGASRDITLNTLKASLFGVPVKAVKEADASALGSQLLAAISVGDYSSLINAVKDNCFYDEMILPDHQLGSKLKKRFERYVASYPIIKDTFDLFNT